jgi:hypothetical protein
LSSKTENRNGLWKYDLRQYLVANIETVKKTVNGCWNGWSGSVPAEQGWGPGFKPMYCPKKLKTFMKIWFNWASVVHACNPNYSGGRDQKDCVVKTAGADSSWNMSKKSVIKEGRQSGSRCSPWTQTTVPQNKRRQ